MANEQEIKIKITGEDDASPTLKAAIDKLNASIGTLTQVQLGAGAAARKSKEDHEGLKVGLINVTAAFTLVKEAGEIAMHVFHAIERQLEHAIEEALEFEKANNRLAGALVATGQYTAETVEQIERYVEGAEDGTKGLEQLVGANGELVKSMIASGVQMGLSIQQAKGMEEAARKLAAATGKDVNEAFALLQGSLTGQSRGLAKVLPQIKEFGEAQLKQGSAIDLVNRQLDAQYKLYQQSLPAALDRAKVATDNVYKAFGLMITQSDLAKRAVDLFTAGMQSLEHGIKAVDKWITQNKQSIYDFGEAFGKAALIVGGSVIAYSLATAAIAAMSAGLGLASIAAGAFAAVMAVITSPITLTIAAVGALTIALYKWPGLFDIIIGSMKTLIGVALLPLSATIGALTIAIGASAKALGAEWGASVEAAGKKLVELNTTLIAGGIEQVKYGATSVAAGKQVQDSHEKNTEKAKEELAAQSQLNAIAAQRGKLYADTNIGTEKQREALRAEVQDRDKDLKDYSDYLDAKKRLAISKKDEEQMELAKVQSKALEGTGGPQAKQAGSNVAVDNEIRKQAELDTLYQQGIITRQQYQEASLASDQRAAQAELEFQLAHKEERATLLGDSEEGYAAKAELEEQRWQLELQNKLARAEQENMTDMEIKAVREQAEMEHQARVNQIREDQIQNDIKRNEQLHNNWGVTLGKIRLEQERHGKILGTIRGIQATEEFRGAQQALTDLSSLRNSHSKKAFEIGKAAATAQAVVNTFTAATGAYASLAAIPIVGPALGAAAAAAAIAAGYVNIQNIQSQKFSGGQADEGMDSVPGSLAGKSFILSQGERVVQPSANRDLKEFLANEKTGGGGGGNTYAITLNYGGSGSREDASKMADIIIEEIRARSERGAPIMSERGLTKA